MREGSDRLFFWVMMAVAAGSSAALAAFLF
jgi:hypothetical protein